MRPRFWMFGWAVLLLAQTAVATTFVVPTDDELTDEADQIVIGTVEGSYSREIEGEIETVFEIRVEQSLKGSSRPSDLIQVTELGGIVGDRGVLVPGSPNYRQGERVLAFLEMSKGRLRTVDMMLGKFKFTITTSGEHVLVRDTEDVVGWDQSGRPHREKVRLERGFLRFVEGHLRRQDVPRDYLVDASAVTLSPEVQTQSSTPTTNAAPFPPETYVSWVSNLPPRWPNISAGVTFYKRSDQNIAGAADGGVGVIQNGLAAWNNDCASVINLIYGGQRATASANHDGVNVVEFNDPQERISGSWTGAGTVAITFLSFASNHTFNGRSWINITDADVVFQNGYTASNASFPTAMTHELGHAIGWRHSNQDYATGGSCNSSVEECTSAAIMNSTVNANYGYTLQPFDVHAAESVYPGGSCGPACTPPAITAQPTSRTISGGSSTTLSVSASGTTPLTYQWYQGASGDTSRPLSTGSSITVSPSSTTSYWVRVSNSCGTANSSTATVTVTGTAPPSGQDAYMDFNGDGKSEMIWRNSATGQLAMWEMSGRTILNGSVFITMTDANWKVLGFGDFDGDGDDDVLLRNAVTGQVSVWLMSGRAVVATGNVGVVPLSWQMHAIGDFHGDGKDELIWRNTVTGEVAMWEMNGTSLVNGSVFITIADQNWQIQTAGDFTGDGRDELLLRNTASGQLAMWEMNGRTLLNGSVFQTVSDQNWQIAAVGDFNGDNRTDILWRNTATGNVAMWEMNGRTLINGDAIGIVPLEWQIERAGDFNADGKDEIILYNRNTTDVAMWEMSGHTILNGSVFVRIGDSNWKMQPRGGVRPALDSP